MLWAGLDLFETLASCDCQSIIHCILIYNVQPTPTNVDFWELRDVQTLDECSMLLTKWTLQLWLTSEVAAKPTAHSNDTALGDSVASMAGCAAVNFFVTAFTPQIYATAFCSAYLDIYDTTWTSTTTSTAQPS